MVLVPAYLLECSRLRVMPAAARPVGGVDYPRTYQEFTAWFSDDAACREYLGNLRWPDGFICPECGCGGGWRTRQGVVDVRRVRQEDLGDGRHDLSPFAHAAVDVVRRGLIRHLAEERRLRARPERRAGVRLL